MLLVVKVVIGCGWWWCGGGYGGDGGGGGGDRVVIIDIGGDVGAWRTYSRALFVGIVGVSDALSDCRAFVGHCRNVGCRALSGICRAFVGLSLLTDRLRPCDYARPLVGMSECRNCCRIVGTVVGLSECCRIGLAVGMPTGANNLGALYQHKHLHQCCR